MICHDIMLKNSSQNLAAIAESEYTNELTYLDEIAILPELFEINNKMTTVMLIV